MRRVRSARQSFRTCVRRSRRRTDTRHLRRTHMATDPVCGMLLDEKSAAGTLMYEGTTYFFCSPHCLQKFKDNPADFVHPPSHAVASQRETGAGGALLDTYPLPQ